MKPGPRERNLHKLHLRQRLGLLSSFLLEYAHPSCCSSSGGLRAPAYIVKPKKQHLAGHEKHQKFPRNFQKRLKAEDLTLVQDSVTAFFFDVSWVVRDPIFKLTALCSSFKTVEIPKRSFWLHSAWLLGCLAGLEILALFEAGAAGQCIFKEWARASWPWGILPFDCFDSLTILQHCILHSFTHHHINPYFFKEIVE